MPLDGEFLKWFATLGVGGVLAAFMFYFYRKDVKSYTDLWRGQSDALMTVLEKTAIALTELNGSVKALHRRLDREEKDRRLRRQK